MTAIVNSVNHKHSNACTRTTPPFRNPSPPPPLSQYVANRGGVKIYKRQQNVQATHAQM
uniref:Uncharacterized protein n=1 Tax=Anguilla anguilla TaxID=7936 RepID=A0A0E9UPR6_ANGAN